MSNRAITGHVPGAFSGKVIAVFDLRFGAIARLENVDSKISPTITTIERYARVVGYLLEINFVPRKH